MVTIRTMALTALALVSGGSLLPLAGAQPYQKPSTGGEIQLYSLPTGPAGKPAIPAESPVSPKETPAMPAESPTMPTESPRPNPYSDPEPKPQAQYPSYPQNSEDTADTDWSPPGGLIRIEDYQGVRYVSGGVGEGERAELHSLSNQFNLHLLFAMQGSGDYLADVRVNALNSRGDVVLNAESNGPWFFAQLSPGTYTIEVSIPDQLQRQTVRIEGSRQSQLNFYWR